MAVTTVDERPLHHPVQGAFAVGALLNAAVRAPGSGAWRSQDMAQGRVFVHRTIDLPEMA